MNIKIGGGFFSALALLFIALKLTGFISWSWLWVTAPIWGPIVLWGGGFLVITLVLAVIAGIGVLIYKLIDRM
ncbi:hypothetical protein 278BB001_56 [Bacillus phage 278BB001]|nr:hypothetical protein 010DV004_66 [Bacillus phage 010DV004]QZA69283.1 hypothetical protein 010DV005_66 [Bacillus phage 010DV005]QZA70207.1 hypothetical protein 278BB001_56 [Bacillus phage 278BB001]